MIIKKTDVLPLYLGCECRWKQAPDEMFTFNSYSASDGVCTLKHTGSLTDFHGIVSPVSIYDITPILYLPKEMDMVMAREFSKIKDGAWGHLSLPMLGLGTIAWWLIKNKFDIFDLIKNGEALNGKAL
jgi:hypothetical protein